jgi:RecA/RadA recombinase
MKVINLFGGPGSGKSTLAASIFCELKKRGYSAEIPSEYAKKLVYTGRAQCLRDQLYLLGKQNNKLEMLRGKVDYVIMDSPLPLCLLYKPSDYYQSFDKLLMEVFNSYDNVNFFIRRSHAYEQSGRYQNEEEADQVSLNTLEMLSLNDIKYTTVSTCDANLTGKVLDYILLDELKGN